MTYKITQHADYINSELSSPVANPALQDKYNKLFQQYKTTTNLPPNLDNLTKQQFHDWLLEVLTHDLANVHADIVKKTNPYLSTEKGATSLPNFIKEIEKHRDKAKLMTRIKQQYHDILLIKVTMFLQQLAKLKFVDEANRLDALVRLVSNFYQYAIYITTLPDAIIRVDIKKSGKEKSSLCQFYYWLHDRLHYFLHDLFEINPIILNLLPIYGYLCSKEIKHYTTCQHELVSPAYLESIRKNYFTHSITVDHNPFLTLFNHRYQHCSIKEQLFWLNICNIYPSNKAVKQAGFIINLFGCHGMDAGISRSAKANQMLAAKKIGPIAVQQQIIDDSRKHEQPDMVIQLGDNAYMNGINPKNTPAFFEHNLFSYGVNRHGDHIPNFAVLGNHDYGLWGRYKITELFDGDRETNELTRAHLQILQSYSSNDHWNMPNHYYVLEHENVVFIMLDSNIIMFDQLQQQWLCDVYQHIKTTRPGKKIIGVAHHPLVYLGKRAAKPCEWKKHLSMANRQWKIDLDANAVLFNSVTSSFDTISPPVDDEIHEFNNIGKFMLELFRRNNIHFDMWLCAHEHMTAIHDIAFKNSSHCVQIIAGGSGAELSGVKDHYLPGGRDNPIDKLPDVANVNCILLAQKHAYVSLKLLGQSIYYRCLSPYAENTDSHYFAEGEEFDLSKNQGLLNSRFQVLL